MKKILMILIPVIIIGILVFLILPKDKENNDDVITDVPEVPEISKVEQVLINMENLDSFVATKSSVVVSADPNYPNMTTESVLQFDKKNETSYLKQEMENNGYKSIHENYVTPYNDGYKTFGSSNGDWFLIGDANPIEYGFNFYRMILDVKEYTVTEDGNKLIVETSFLAKEATNIYPDETSDTKVITLKMIIEGDYLIETNVQYKDELVDDTQKTTFTNINEELNIVVPEEVLKLAE